MALPPASFATTGKRLRFFIDKREMETRISAISSQSAQLAERRKIRIIVAMEEIFT